MDTQHETPAFRNLLRLPVNPCIQGVSEQRIQANTREYFQIKKMNRKKKNNIFSTEILFSRKSKSENLSNLREFDYFPMEYE